MLMTNTIGSGPYKPVIKNVFNAHQVWVLDHEFVNEDDAIAYADNKLEIIHEAIRKSLYSEGFQIQPGT